MEAAETKLADAPPDWSAIQREILCPLCDYNLRGLAEPRCPECGYQFTWAGLQDDLRNQQEWFFEHQKRRPIRSLVKTWRMSQLPRRFWTKVQPTNSPSPKRMLSYWSIVVAALLILVVLASYLHPMISYYDYIRSKRQALLEYVQKNPNDRWNARNLADFGSPQAVVDATIPYPWPWQLRGALRSASSPAGEILAQLGALLLVWPWLTLLTMIIFRQSLRQARIKTVHLLRCVIYASDVAPLMLLPAAYALAAQIAFWIGDVMVFKLGALMTVAVLFGVLCYRLTIAYKLYLHFPHAAATCIATQLIVILLAFYFLPWTF